MLIGADLNRRYPKTTAVVSFSVTSSASTEHELARGSREIFAYHGEENGVQPEVFTCSRTSLWQIKGSPERAGRLLIYDKGV